MQKDSKLFDDMARMMSGATNMAFDMKREVEAVVARQMETMLGKTSLVTREEFEAVKTMVTNARTEADALREELDLIKAELAAMSSSMGLTTKMTQAVKAGAKKK